MSRCRLGSGNLPLPTAHWFLLFLYYITDRMQFPGVERERRERLLEKIAEAARCGVDYVQLREKDLPTRDLEALAREAMERIRASVGQTRLMINSRADVALAVGAGGIHLRSKDISPADVRKMWCAARGAAPEPIVAVSCHTEAEVVNAEKADADFVAFGPVFGKNASEMGAVGLDLLRTVCRGRIPVFALGGVTVENAAICADAGAKGVAGIRFFQENNVAALVARFRS